MSDYSAKKVVQAFRDLGSEVYVSHKRIKVEFPDSINRFHEKQLKLAFKKTSGDIYHLLVERKIIKPKEPEEMIRVL